MNIKDVIKIYGLTSKVVADRMGITPIGLSQHINGNPSVEVLERIASAIGCGVGEFFEQPAIDIINCPYCGKKIKISKE